MRSFNKIYPLWCVFNYLAASEDLFCSRIFHSSIIFNNILYVDGGETRFLSKSGSVTASVVTDIEALDLSKPWSNTGSLPWASYPKPNSTGSSPTSSVANSTLNPPTLNDGAMWAQGPSLILFGGALSNALGGPKTIPPQGTWRWNIVQNGWTKLGFSGQPVQRIHLGVAAQSSTGEGYYLGGAITPRSDVRFNSLPGAQPYMVSGLVILQENTLSFSNVSTVGLNDYNTMTAGYAVLIESLGLKGVLVSFGGIKNTVGVGIKLDPSGLVDPKLQNTLDRISVYDIAAKSWYQQPATGDVPSWRYFGCSIVVSAQDKSSHSIYIFGGWGNSESRSDGSVYVLTIPSFRWIRVTEDAKPRIKNTCHLLGKHTMLVVGGTTPTDTAEFNTAPSYCDGVGNFANGLGIFSLQTHTWNTAYNPSDDAPYELHPQITAIIGGSGKGGATLRSPAKGFNNTQLLRLLGGALPATAPKKTPGNNSSQVPSPTNPPPTNLPPNNPRKTLSAGLVAGIGVGATVVFAIIVVLHCRWARRTSHPNPRSPPNFSPNGSFRKLVDMPNLKAVSEQEMWDDDPIAARELSSRKSVVAQELSIRMSVPPQEIPSHGTS